MKRAIALALLVLAATFVAPSTAAAAPTAPAQNANACFPGSDPQYPPTGNAVQIEASLRLESALFVPGGSGTIVIVGAAANATYCGVTFSTPITLPAKQADAQGKLVYNIAVPKDFELSAMHHIDVFRAQRQVASFDFCVNAAGSLAPNSACAKKPTTPAGPLARTGTNSTLNIIRAAVLVLGVGVGALYLRRRRQHGATTAG